MPSLTTNRTYLIITLLLGAFFLISTFAFGWTEPTTAPPANNLPSPLNVGSVTQTKTGILGTTGGGAYGLGGLQIGQQFLNSNNNGWLSVGGDADALNGIYDGQGIAAGSLLGQSIVYGPLFWDLDNTGAENFSLDPKGTSKLNSITSDTRARLGLPDYWTSRWNLIGDISYWTGSQGWGAESLDTNVPEYGSSFFDVWGNPPGQPAGAAHWQGLQAFHYWNSSPSINGYGSQLLFGSSIMNGTMYMRSIWGGVWSPWFGICMSNGVNCPSSASSNLQTVTNAGNSTTNSLYLAHIFQQYGSPVFPGRIDGSGQNYQPWWYLGSHSSYGLYTNTGLYAAGPFLTSGGVYASDKFYSWGTAYSVDPKGTSVMNNLQVDGTIRGASYGFGGMFITDIDGIGCGPPCVQANPFTGSCSCPSGFSDIAWYQFVGCGNNNNTTAGDLHMCIK